MSCHGSCYRPALRVVHAVCATTAVPPRLIRWLGYRTLGHRARTTRVSSSRACGDLSLSPRYGGEHILHTTMASLLPCCCASHAGCSCHGFSRLCGSIDARTSALRCSLMGSSQRCAVAAVRLILLSDSYEGCVNDSRCPHPGEARFGAQLMLDPASPTFFPSWMHCWWSNFAAGGLRMRCCWMRACLLRLRIGFGLHPPASSCRSRLSDQRVVAFECSQRPNVPGWHMRGCLWCGVCLQDAVADGCGCSVRRLLTVSGPRHRPQASFVRIAQHAVGFREHWLGDAGSVSSCELVPSCWQM